MARLEIPALYRLDIGNSRWGWHKMDDLRTSIGLLFERSQHGLPEALREGASSDGRPTAQTLLREYGHLNVEETFGWTDEQDIDFVSVEEVPLDRPNLFVPAQWSLRTIDAVKNIVNPPKLYGKELFKLTQHCLSERERKVMELRFGVADGVEWSQQKIAKTFKTTRERIRQIEAKAERNMRLEELTPTRTAKEAKKHARN